MSEPSVDHRAPLLGAAWNRLLLRVSKPASGSGVAANLISLAAGQVGLVLAQALFVAVGTRALGVDAFGEWLIVSAVPAYLAMADLGLVVSTSNGIQRHVVLGQVATAQGRLSAALGLIWLLSILMLVPAACALLLLQEPLSAALSTFSAAQLSILLALFLFDFASSTSASLSVAVLRAYDRFASAQLVFNTLKVGQILVLAGAVLLTRDVVLSFFLSLCLRLPGFILLVLWARRFSGWPWKAWTPTLGRLGWDELRAARGPFALTLANALHYQGFVSIVGLAIGPGAAVIVFAARTLVRLPTMLVNVVGAATMPPLVRAQASGSGAEVRRLATLLFAPVLVITALYLPFILTASDEFIRAWANLGTTDLGGLRHIVAVDCIAICTATAATYLLLATERVAATAAMALVGYLILLLGMSAGALPSLEAALTSLAGLNVVIAIAAAWQGAFVVLGRQR